MIAVMPSTEYAEIADAAGSLLGARLVVMLIGERPGLATAESLSAYLAYRPRRNHCDANRNLVSNIHVRGVSPEDAAVRILHFAERMMKLGASGYHIREELPPAGLPIIGQ